MSISGENEIPKIDHSFYTHRILNTFQYPEYLLDHHRVKKKQNHSEIKDNKLRYCRKNGSSFPLNDSPMRELKFFFTIDQL
jgi:hypothetical protein